MNLAWVARNILPLVLITISSMPALAQQINDWRQLQEDLDPSPLTPLPENTDIPTFSPDGKFLLLGCDSHSSSQAISSVMFMRLSQGERNPETRTTTLNCRCASDPVFANDPETVYYLCADKPGLFSLNLKTKQIAKTQSAFAFSGEHDLETRLNRGATHFMQPHKQQGFVVRELKSGKTVYDSENYKSYARFSPDGLYFFETVGSKSLSTTYVVDLRAGRLLRTLPTVEEFEYSADLSKLFYCSMEPKSCTILAAKDLKQIAVVDDASPSKRGCEAPLTFSPTGSELYRNCENKIRYVYSSKTGAFLYNGEINRSSINTVTYFNQPGGTKQIIHSMGITGHNPYTLSYALRETDPRSINKRLEAAIDTLRTTVDKPTLSIGEITGFTQIIVAAKQRRLGGAEFLFDKLPKNPDLNFQVRCLKTAADQLIPLSCYKFASNSPSYRYELENMSAEKSRSTLLQEKLIPCREELFKLKESIEWGCIETLARSSNDLRDLMLSGVKFKLTSEELNELAIFLLGSRSEYLDALFTHLEGPATSDLLNWRTTTKQPKSAAPNQKLSNSETLDLAKYFLDQRTLPPGANLTPLLKEVLVHLDQLKKHPTKIAPTDLDLPYAGAGYFRELLPRIRALKTKSFLPTRVQVKHVLSILLSSESIRQQDLEEAAMFLARSEVDLDEDLLSDFQITDLKTEVEKITGKDIADYKDYSSFAGLKIAKLLMSFSLTTANCRKDTTLTGVAESDQALFSQAFLWLGNYGDFASADHKFFAKIARLVLEKFGTSTCAELRNGMVRAMHGWALSDSTLQTDIIYAIKASYPPKPLLERESGELQTLLQAIGPNSNLSDFMWIENMKAFRKLDSPHDEVFATLLDYYLGLEPKTYNRIKTVGFTRRPGLIKKFCRKYPMLPKDSQQALESFLKILHERMSEPRPLFEQPNSSANTASALSSYFVTDDMKTDLFLIENGCHALPPEIQTPRPSHSTPKSQGVPDFDPRRRVRRQH